MNRRAVRPHRPLAFPLLIGGIAMPAKKDDATEATHYATNTLVGPFARGVVVTTEELHGSFGLDTTLPEGKREAHHPAALKRLLALGAITPTEAPEEAEPQATPDPEEVMRASEKALAEA